MWQTRVAADRRVYTGCTLTISNENNTCATPCRSG